MLSRKTKNLLKRKEKYARLLDYYDTTSKLPTKKLLRSFTIEQVNFDRLKAEAARTGKTMSELLDELIENNI